VGPTGPASSKSSVPDKKRGIQLSNTNQGLETLKQIVPPTVASQEMLLASLPKEYRKVFKHCLEIILESNDASLRD
jgi:DNA-binding MarR family transcriptional regulator